MYMHVYAMEPKVDACFDSNACVYMQFRIFPTLFQGILIVIWKLTTGHISGIFIAVNVLDTVTNFGQVTILSIFISVQGYHHKVVLGCPGFLGVSRLSRVDMI